VFEYGSKTQHCKKRIAAPKDDSTRRKQKHRKTSTLVQALIIQMSRKGDQAPASSINEINDIFQDPIHQFKQLKEKEMT
jgi:hypothetical protein